MKQEYEENENTIGYRITELRKDRGLSQKEVADRIHVSSSQISRIESGNTVDVNNDILIALAQLFHVSTDYLLDLTKIQEPRNYDIAQVQLSEKAVKKMMSGTIDMDVLNRILEHERFPALCTQIRYYFDDTIADGIAGRNEIIALATGPLSELKAADPSRKTEIVKDLRFINSQKIGSHEIDIEKITKDFIKILRDVKDSIQNHESTDAVATSEIIQKNHSGDGVIFRNNSYRTERICNHSALQIFSVLLSLKSVCIAQMFATVFAPAAPFQRQRSKKV